MLRNWGEKVETIRVRDSNQTIHFRDMFARLTKRSGGKNMHRGSRINTNEDDDLDEMCYVTLAGCGGRGKKKK